MLSSWFWRRGFETARVETVHAFSDKLARVPHRIIDRIRQTILLSDYDMTVHAVEEMAEDDLDIFDIEEAILNGQVVQRNKEDPRGTKYTIEGLALDRARLVGVVGRFPRPDRFLIITVYEVSKVH